MAVKEDIYDPLNEYINVFRDRFRKVAADTFAQLAQEANVDVKANRKTCDEMYQLMSELDEVNSNLRKWKWIRALFIFVVLACIVVAIHQWDNMTPDLAVILGVTVAASLIFLVAKVESKIDQHKDESHDLRYHVRQLREEAWKQMQPLNRLYDWDVLTRMMSATVPRLEFDPYFTTQRLADLEHTYGWTGSFNVNRSVVYSHSGLINGNPFVICRTKKMIMGAKTYEGTKSISWTTTERGSDGKMHTVRHYETLVAQVTAPYPEYYAKTRLIYGNTAAPDLIFYRRKSGLADKEGSLSYKWKRHKLRNKARNLSNADFAMMTNEEFEVAFDTSNRNNNQQFALLFTPLAQESMLNLLKDNTTGYGDDFDFQKHKMINTIVPDHMQEIDLDMNPEQYRSFDFKVARTQFCDVNARYFRAIYFALAPLLCVPMYQQIRPAHDIYGIDMPRQSSFWEHEALANFWGNKHFKHPECVTDCILKTKVHRSKGEKARITVFAHGYRVEKRLTFVEKMGGDGRYHKVPVYWNEYLPVTGTGEIDIKEDNAEDEFPTQTDRLNHINEVLNEGSMTSYRRHIASGV